MGFVVFSPIVRISAVITTGAMRRTAFMCPCHGSQYTFDGTHIAGPAPRGLDPLPLRNQKRHGRSDVDPFTVEYAASHRRLVSGIGMK